MMSYIETAVGVGQGQITCHYSSQPLLQQLLIRERWSMGRALVRVRRDYPVIWQSFNVLTLREEYRLIVDALHNFQQFEVPHGH